MHASTPELEHRFIDLNGLRLHWAELGGTTDETPLILLHGLNNSHRTWREVAPLLAGGRRVLMPDLPGHGDSERPDASYTLAWHAGIVADWLRAIGIERFDVVGHSFGGGVAQMLLLELPEKLRRLVLVASGGLGKDVGWTLRLASVPVVVERFGQPFMRLGTRLALRDAQGGVSAEDVAELSAFNARPGSARAFARTVRDVVSWKGQRRTFFQRAHQLPQLPPVLVLWGDRDGLIPIAQGLAFARRVEGTVFKRFEGCGHYLHNEKAVDFAAVVSEFLEDDEAVSVRLATPHRCTPEAPELTFVGRLRAFADAQRPLSATYGASY
jgi:pimeloyl-ACP methyl ester carboxylesterase